MLLAFFSPGISAGIRTGRPAVTVINTGHNAATAQRRAPD